MPTRSRPSATATPDTPPRQHPSNCAVTCPGPDVLSRRLLLGLVLGLFPEAPGRRAR